MISLFSRGKKASNKRAYARAIGLPLWVLIAFGAAQIIVVGVVSILRSLGILLTEINQALLNTCIAAIVYLLTLSIALGVPWLVKKYRTTKEDLGLAKDLSWLDIGLAPAGLVIYLLISSLLVYAASFVPGFNADQLQDTGFTGMVYSYEYLVAFITLVIIAPLAEEIIFRGFLFGKLKRAVPVWAAMLITSMVFGAIHGQWNVAIDVFALSLIMCGLREITGSIWAGVLLHMLKNGLAFYILFINPM